MRARGRPNREDRVRVPDPLVRNVLMRHGIPRRPAGGRPPFRRRRRAGVPAAMPPSNKMTRPDDALAAPGRKEFSQRA